MENTNFRLATIALWHLFTNRKVIKLNDPTMALIEKYAPDQFNHLMKQPLPTTMEAKPF
jgi:hypothetical protein